VLTLENLEHAAGDISRRVLLRTIGTTTKRYAHYKKHGLSLDLADKWSERLGLHPAEVWPNWVEKVLHDAA